MIWYIYLLKLGFHPVAGVSGLGQKQERDNTKGKTINKTIKKQYKITKYTK